MMRTYLSPTNEEETDFSKIEVRPMFYHAIVQGYSVGMKGALSIEEQNSFFLAGQFLMYMQSLRFLTDYFNNDVYYGSQFQEHNLARARNQLSLFSAFIRARKRLKTWRMVNWNWFWIQKKSPNLDLLSWVLKNLIDLLSAFSQGKSTAKSDMKNLIEMAAVDGNFDDVEYDLL